MDELCCVYVGEYLKVFCFDYDEFCCSICVVIYYRYCEWVEVLEEIIKNLLEINIGWNIDMLFNIVKVIEELIE